MSVGLLGSGKMAQAMARGLITSGMYSRDQIIASTADKTTFKEMESLGVGVTWDNKEAVKGKEVVVAAVKPNVLPEVLTEVAPIMSPRSLLVSLAAGVKTQTIETFLPNRSRVVRVMPNIPVLIRQGASAFALGINATKSDSEMVQKLMSAVGYVQEVKEKDLAAVTGLSGSGPVYSFIAIEALSDGGVKAGLPRDLAIKLAAHTLMGATRLVLETNRHPAELKDNVCSPEGTTVHAVHMLEKAGLRATLIDAVEAAVNRAIELGKQQ